MNEIHIDPTKPPEMDIWYSGSQENMHIDGMWCATIQSWSKSASKSGWHPPLTLSCLWMVMNINNNIARRALHVCFLHQDWLLKSELVGEENLWRWPVLNVKMCGRNSLVSLNRCPHDMAPTVQFSVAGPNLWSWPKSITAELADQCDEKWLLILIGWGQFSETSVACSIIMSSTFRNSDGGHGYHSLTAKFIYVMSYCTSSSNKSNHIRTIMNSRCIHRHHQLLQCLTQKSSASRLQMI